MGTDGPIAQGFAWGSFETEISDPNAIYMGDSLDSLRNKSAIATALELGSADILATTVREVIFELFTQHADPTGAVRWKPLIPTLGLRLELHIGGHSLVKSERFDQVQHPLVLEVEKLNYRKIREDAIQGRINRDTQFHRRYLSRLVEKYHLPFGSFIPSDLPSEAPLPHSTTVTDNFNRADEELGASADWDEDSGDFEIVSNAVDLIATGGDGRNSAEHQTALASDDHYSQADIESLQGTSGIRVEVKFRYADHNNFYSAGTTDRGSDTVDLFRRVTGTITEINAPGPIHDPWVDGDTLYGEVDGSSLDLRVNGTSEHTGTDTALTGQTHVGIGAQNQDPAMGWDNFEGADLAVGEILVVEEHQPGSATWAQARRTIVLPY